MSKSSYETYTIESVVTRNSCYICLHLFSELTLPFFSLEDFELRREFSYDEDIKDTNQNKSF